MANFGEIFGDRDGNWNIGIIKERGNISAVIIRISHHAALPPLQHSRIPARRCGATPEKGTFYI
jgi:hypothetical protein